MSENKTVEFPSDPHRLAPVFQLPLFLPELDNGSTLMESIGHGSFGNVYLSKTSNNAWRAVKSIPFRDEGQTYGSHKLNEAQLLSDLKNGHVVKLYDSKIIRGIMWVRLTDFRDRATPPTYFSFALLINS